MELNNYLAYSKQIFEMFLVTTADQRFWKTDEKILFLGEWCRLYEQKAIWSELNQEVLPWHWYDRAKLIRDAQYIQDLNNKILPILASKLNTLHGVDHSCRYWRIILGNWLNYFVGAFFDRFTSVQNAIDVKKITHTWVPAQDITSYVSKNFNEFENWLGQDSYNFLIYSWIIQQLKVIPFEIKNDIKEPISLENISSKTSLNWKDIFKKVIEECSCFIPDRFNQVVFCGFKLKPWNLACLQVALGQIPYLRGPQVDIPEAPINGELRKKLGLSFAENLFEELLEKIVPMQIPKAYIEGYWEMNHRSLRAFPKSPKLICSSAGLYFHEGFKFWAAAMVDQGTQLIGSQHGGHYGSNLISSKEDHEIACSNRFFSWGWKKENTSKVTPLPSAQLAETFQSLKSNPKGSILFVDLEDFLQIKSVASGHLGPTMLKRLASNQCFVEGLLPEVRKLLFVRLHPADRGWGSEERWKEFDSNISVYRGKESVFRQLNRSRLLIVSYNSTTHLETLAANFPTLFFWRPDLTELRASAQEHHDSMCSVGVFHESPESAAEKLNQIYEDPLGWWLSPEIQKARKEFCLQYAWTKKNWCSDWKNELLKIAGK